VFDQQMTRQKKLFRQY